MFHQCRTFAFDCDGTLFNQNGLIDGALQIINYLKKTNRRILYITNNSTRTDEEHLNKLIKLGLPAELNEIVGVGKVTAYSLSKRCVKGPLYVIGEEGLCRELSKFEISTYGPGPENMNFKQFSSSSLDPKTKGVLVAFDPDFNYVKLMKAATFITRGLPFYATNEDAQLPAIDHCKPGNGAIVAAVRVASGTEPIVFGKPNKATFDYIQSKFEIDPKFTVMVGDRLDTDIQFGNAFGMHSVCVMTGVTSEGQLHSVRDSQFETQHLVPEFVFPGVAELLTQVIAQDHDHRPLHHFTIK